MSQFTNIQWATHTYNSWRGCRKVAPECANCYITTTMPFRMSGQVHGGARVRAGVKAMAEPMKWNRAAEKAGERHRVFCLSLGDWLDDENVPIEWLAELLNMIHVTRNLDWLLLTKRPQNWMRRLEAVEETGLSNCEVTTRWINGTPPANVWIGVSAGANQAAALAIPAPIHFLSAEPMLGPLNTEHAAGFDWIIFGGESGPRARKCDVAWIREGVRFCKANGIACFVKQLGANIVAHWETTDIDEIRNFPTIRDKKGGDPAEWPEDLRVREFPNFARTSTESVRRTAAGPVSDPAQSPACAGGAVQSFQPTNHKP